MNLMNALADLGAATRRVMAGWGYGARLLARLLAMFKGKNMPFDGMRMFWGGFKTMIEMQAKEE